MRLHVEPPDGEPSRTPDSDRPAVDDAEPTAPDRPQAAGGSRPSDVREDYEPL
jgi:hypothetical protein